MMRYAFLLLAGWVLFLPGLRAQSDLFIFEDFRKIDIPFEYQHNLIVVDVMFQKIFPLKFIFDTGAENTILSKKEVTDILAIPYEREFKLMGSDLKTELTAYLVRNIHIRTGDMIIPRHSMLVLDEDYFRFEEIAGLEVHGILGADAFRGLVVKINYERKLITLYKRERFDPPKDYDAMPLEIHRNKAYLNTDLFIRSDSISKVKLLLDSGAMIPLMLNADTVTQLHLPPNVLKGNIGAGLGGFIEGYVGRVKTLQMGAFKLHESVTYFQELVEGIDTNMLNNRNGILGNEILSRFHIIIDYPKEVLYLKPNKHNKKKFKFDKSGLVVIATDTGLKNFIVHHVIKGTPAAEASLLPGDQIHSLNCIPAAFLTLTSINQKLKKREGKKIKLVVKRNGKRLTFRFRLRKLI